jgi:hypothetical protein
MALTKPGRAVISVSLVLALSHALECLRMIIGPDWASILVCMMRLRASAARKKASCE